MHGRPCLAQLSDVVRLVPSDVSFVADDLLFRCVRGPHCAVATVSVTGPPTGGAARRLLFRVAGARSSAELSAAQWCRYVETCVCPPARGCPTAL